MLKRFAAFLIAMVGFSSLALAQTAPVSPYAPPPAEPENIVNLQLSTGGVVRLQLRPDKAPGHVARYKLLVRSGFYDGLVFHRVIDGFMAQTGDPTGTGAGGSPLPDIKAEFNDMPHMRGTLSAARTSEPDTANSQFFIVFMPTMSLDGKYTGFGRVISGMPFVDAIERGEPPVAPSKVIKAWIEADGPDAPRVPLPAVAAAPVAPETPAP